MRKLGFFVLCAVWFVSGCSGAGGDAGEEKTELVVSAAASLADAMSDIAAAYGREHPDVSLQLNFGSSGALQKQIEQGAPADLFFSAGERQMQALSEQGLMDREHVTALLTNELVVVVPADSQARLQSVEDLLQPSIVRIAVGQPGIAPVGTYAKASLTHYGVWDVLQPRIVYAKDARQALTYAETGNTDAAWVYRSDAAASDKVRIAWTAERDSHPPIAYSVGVVRTSARPEAALKFYNYLRSEAAIRVFEHYGFRRAGS